MHYISKDKNRRWERRRRNKSRRRRRRRSKIAERRKMGENAENWNKPNKH